VKDLEGGKQMSGTIRLTAAQAMMRWLSVQMTEDGERFIEGVWAIFGHGNVAGIGEALHGIGDALPTGAARTSRRWRTRRSLTPRPDAAAASRPSPRRSAPAPPTW
jgi:3D-(3,5/4)-trihydroxycyclohexane-1,2-dione acylhydrolase (decyclizing)